MKEVAREYMDLMELSHLNFLISQQELAKVGIYKGQPRVLIYIKNHPNTTNAMIVKKTGLKPSTVSVMISRLQARNLVEKSTNEKINLTREGEEVVKDTIAIMNHIFEVMYKDFTEEELKQLEGYHNKMIENLRSYLKNEEA